MTKDIIQSIPIIGIFLIYVIGMMIASQRTKKKYPDYHVIKLWLGLFWHGSRLPYCSFSLFIRLRFIHLPPEKC